MAVVLLVEQEELAYSSYLQLKIINTKNGGKNGSPKLAGEEWLEQIIAIVITHSVFLFVLISISKDDQENNDFWRIAKAKHAPKNFQQGY